MARRHVALATARRDREAICLAYAGLGDAFARIESWDRFDITVAEFDEAFALYDGRFSVPLTRCLFRLRAERALAESDPERAQAELEGLDALGTDVPDEPEQVRGTLLFHADIALRMGRPQLARTILAEIAASGAPAGADALDAEHLALRCTLAIDGAEAAACATARMLD